MNAAQTNEDVTALLRARHTLFWIVSREELRVERALVDACLVAKYRVRFWDSATGLTDETGKLVADTKDAGQILEFIRRAPERYVYVLRDYHKWLPDPFVLRSVRSLARELQSQKPDNARAIVILSPSTEVPAELPNATVIDYPLPDRGEVSNILDNVLNALKESDRADAAPNGTRDRAIDAALGLSAEEIANCYARSLVTMNKKIDPVLVSNEKRRVIAREKVLTWHEPDPRGLDAIGGLDYLKKWLVEHRAAFSPRARAFGLPAPKGAMLVGVPGCGKVAHSEGRRGCMADAATPPRHGRAQEQVRGRERAQHPQGAQRGRGREPVRGVDGRDREGAQRRGGRAG